MAPATLPDAAAAVQRGGVVLYPTETVYGLGCDPRIEPAVDRIRRLKGRDADKPMLAVTDRWGRVERWISDLTNAHRRLMQAADSVGQPLAVTLLFSPGPECPEGLIGPGGLVGIRRTSDAVCRALVAACGTAILSTSANPAGEPPPSTFDAVDASILAGVDAAVDAGRPLQGTPSTVVQVRGEEIVVLREGAVTAEQVREVAASG
jgi:L-threonylcarbamoyladenylate synthase